MTSACLFGTEATCQLLVREGGRSGGSRGTEVECCWVTMATVGSGRGRFVRRAKWEGGRVSEVELPGTTMDP